MCVTNIQAQTHTYTLVKYHTRGGKLGVEKQVRESTAARVVEKAQVEEAEAKYRRVGGRGEAVVLWERLYVWGASHEDAWVGTVRRNREHGCIYTYTAYI